MHQKTEELLNTLLWAMDMFARPTLRNVTSSYEQWAYRNGFSEQLQRLERANLLTRDQQSLGQRVYSLTKAGRLKALGGRDPAERWARSWDGVWRLVLFDLPNGEIGLRDKFRRLLRLHYLGCLQRSVWVSPEPVPDVKDTLEGHDVRSVLILETRLKDPTMQDQIVDVAWPWEEINALYARHLEIFDQHPKGRLLDEAAARRFRRWTELERQAWLAAVNADPLLPATLLPKTYLGRRAWTVRQQSAARVADQIASFEPV